MVDWADIVIENMRPGVISRMGLGYETLSKSNPGLVMLSTCNMGQSGPRAMTPGFGTQLSALAGFCGLTGSSDGPPMLLYGPYIDFIAANFGAAAVLAALDKSRKTGKGSWIDLSQYETGLLFIAGALFEYHSTGKIADRAGNADLVTVPHGAYRCRDNRWITLSCWTEPEFAALLKLMGKADLAKDTRFKSREARKQHEVALNGIISTWSENQDADSLAEALQSAGVCSYPVNTVADVFTDPQLRELEIWRWRRHPVMGLQAYQFPSFNLCDTPGDIYNAAPLFGGDNDIVFRDYLGLGDKEMEKYRAEGVIG
jgi:crotonobetainyl-CoA:carnitine CoA-transferase CaiB-like acyl-CoA transferase